MRLRAINRRGRVIAGMLQATGALALIQILMAIIAVAGGNATLSFSMLMSNLLLITGVGAGLTLLGLWITRKDG